MEEGKAKLAEPETIVEHVFRALGPRLLEGKRVLVVNGATQEPLDDMRVLSNRSSGRTGVALALEAWRLGADVEHWCAHGEARLPAHLPTRRFSSVEDLVAIAREHARKFDAVLVPAALSDFAPERRQGKIPSSGGDLELHLRALPKAIDEIRSQFDGALVPFKAESGVSDADLAARARATLTRTQTAFVVATRLHDP